MTRLLACGFLAIVFSQPAAIGQEGNPVRTTPAKPGDKPAKGLELGKDLPGSFNPFALNGPHKDHFHCFVSDHGLNPAFMVLVKGTEVSEGLKSLLMKLDVVREKKTNSHLGVFVVFVPEDLGNQITDDVKRRELATRLEDEVVKPLKLKNILFGMTSPNDVRAYALPQDTQIACILYNKYHIQSLQLLGKDGLTEDIIKQLMVATVEKLLGSGKK